MFTPVAVGATITYVIRLTNQGSAKERNVRLSITLPTNLEFVSAAGPVDHVATTGLIEFDPLPAIDARALSEFRLVVRALAAGVARLPVTVATQSLTRPLHEFESTTVYDGSVRSAAVLGVELNDDTDPVEVGSHVAYHVDVTNFGSAPAKALVVRVFVPRGMGFVDARGGGGAHRGKLVDGTVEFEPLTALAPKARERFTVVLRARVGGEHRVNVEVSSPSITAKIPDSELTKAFQ